MDKRAEGISTIHCNLRRFLKGRRRGKKAGEICDIYNAIYNTNYGDATMTARFREMRDMVCDLSDYTYRLVEAKK